jgi:hypothetical protein
MEMEKVVDVTEEIMNIICFFIMVFLVTLNLYKYKLNASDNFFVFSLCMYPFAYLFLVIASFIYLNNDDTSNDKMYSFINMFIKPFNYLIMWSIELMLTFEMQLMRVRLETDNPQDYKRKAR